MNEAGKRSVARRLELQGLNPHLLDHAPFTDTGKKEVIGNGVPLPMETAIAKAVRIALAAHKDTP